MIDVCVEKKIKQACSLVCDVRYCVMQSCTCHLTIQVNRKFRAGDVEGARRASEQAQLYSQRGIGCSIILGGAVLLTFGGVLLFVFIYCVDHYRYYGFV